MAINKKKLAGNIAFYVALAIIYSIAIFAIVTKFTGGSIYFFGSRVDIVLTDSMSVRNEHHQDYLEGTTQIQPFDMVVSKEIKDDTELNEKDCVIFRNPELNNELTVHRIVSIYEEGIEFEVKNASKTTFNNEEVFSLDLLTGEVVMAPVDYSSITINAYSSEVDSVYYIITVGKNVITPTCETIEVSSGIYKHTLTYSRDSRAPYKTFISAGTDKNIYISSITYNTDTDGALTFNANELVLDDNNSFKKLFNSYFLYEIRADKSATSDGIFERKALQSKVTGVIPKLGHVVHFIQSLPGILMLVGLSLVITIGSYFYTKASSKKDKDPVVVEDNIGEKKEPKKSKKKE